MLVNDMELCRGKSEKKIPYQCTPTLSSEKIKPAEPALMAVEQIENDLSLL